MVNIDISIEDFTRLIGIDTPLSPQELDELVSFAIAEVDSEPDGPDENGHTKITIDIKTSNRPDLWGAEGISRVLRGMQGSHGLPELGTTPSGFEIIVNPELLNIRPYIGAAIVRGLKLDDFLIKQFIQIQDKVDFSFGRKRKKTSIGIYNINMLESPIHYTVVERSFKFQPLQFEEDLTVDEIFENHPKGIEFRHILDPYEKVPMLYDKNQLVLSMPPIINSNHVGRVTEDTTDVLVEVTGLTHEATNVALSVVVQAMRDRGGEIQSVQINYPKEYKIKSEITPSSTIDEIEIDPKLINKYLGTKFTKKRMVELLRIRTLDAKITDDTILVRYPPWRKEILHWVDISEEIAIAADYNMLGPTDVQVVTPGRLDPSTEDENMIREILTGLGLIETLNYTLTDQETLSENIGRSNDWVDSNCVEISNPVSRKRSIVRPELLPGLIRFAARNTHVEYPQRIFETGECCLTESNDVNTQTFASVLLAGKDETFETIQSTLETLTRLIGIKYELKANESHLYLSGRSAEIVLENEVVGHLGEISPKILENYGIEMPISAMEINLSMIPALKCRRMQTNETPNKL
ncbi:MAG: phenylalanine--tRNA ligase subunit beta [Candidatus Kariarchaeaceae archaeon]|jgi:phenylalanyl-tRNA synthetase beta chain